MNRAFEQRSRYLLHGGSLLVNRLHYVPREAAAEMMRELRRANERGEEEVGMRLKRKKWTVNRDGRKFRLSQGASDELDSLFRKQLQLFREKFKRDPLPDEPIFF